MGIFILTTAVVRCGVCFFTYTGHEFANIREARVDSTDPDGHLAGDRWQCDSVLGLGSYDILVLCPNCAAEAIATLSQNRGPGETTQPVPEGG